MSEWVKRQMVIFIAQSQSCRTSEVPLTQGKREDPEEKLGYTLAKPLIV
jgi:hypothetical protein